jgi:hypothetical protein
LINNQQKNQIYEFRLFFANSDGRGNHLFMWMKLTVLKQDAADGKIVKETDYICERLPSQSRI